MVLYLFYYYYFTNKKPPIKEKGIPIKPGNEIKS